MLTLYRNGQGQLIWNPNVYLRYESPTIIAKFQDIISGGNPHGIDDGPVEIWATEPGVILNCADTSGIRPSPSWHASQQIDQSVVVAGFRAVHWWFGIYDGAFQAKASQLAFGDYTARAPTQSILLDEEEIVLTWTHYTQNTSYEICRSNTPYFEPGDSFAVLLDSIEPLPGEGTITFIDEGAGSDSAMYFYVIRALNANSRADTKPVGKIIFELVPGN